MMQAYMMTHTRTDGVHSYRSVRMDVAQPHYAINASMNQTRQEINTGSLQEENAEPLSSVLDRLMQRYNQELNAYAKHLLGTDDITQDIIQETWIALYMYMQDQSPSWTKTANIFAWLRTVVRNKSLNYMRRQMRMSSLDADDTPFFHEPHMPTFDNPENMAIRDDMNRALYQAIQKLREPQREVIAGRFFYNFSPHQIAQILDIPLNTVKARLTQGKKQLQKLLVESGIKCGDLDAWSLERS